MTDIKVRNPVATALRSRAKAKGISLEGEVCRTPIGSVEADRAELVRQARNTTPRPAVSPEVDSAGMLREERDAWGRAGS